MSSDPLSPPIGLSVEFNQEVDIVLARDPTTPAKQVFFEVWQTLKPQYEAMQQALNIYLTRQLEQSSIRATLHSRLKNENSISESIDRREEFRGKEYDSPGLILNGIHDLLGFRIIVDYPSGLDQSYRLIRKHFTVAGMNIFSSDREVSGLWKPRFGAYEGRNFQVRMSPDQYNSNLSMYYYVLFEIQVTSIAESLYNRLAHPLQYKGSSGELSRQEEMIIDMSHGLSLCYWITIACMEERLEESSEAFHRNRNSQLPETVRTVAGHDPKGSLDDLDDLIKATPDIPVMPGDRSLGSSKAITRMKRTAPSKDTISIELLLRSVIHLPRQYRSDADIWHEIRDKLGLDEETYNRFLKSFTYDRMNDRKNTVPQRHHNTFEWVFDNEQLEAVGGYNFHKENSDSKWTHELELEGYPAAETFRTMDDDPWITPDEDHSLKYEDETPNMDAIETKNAYNQFYEVFGKKVQVPSLAFWLEENRHCLYWVSGKPGSGKSFFMKFIEKDERTIATAQKWQPRCRIISHYLWKPGTDEQSSFRGVICSLLHQILQDNKPITLRLLRETPTLSYKNDATDWDIADSRTLLFDVLSRSNQPYLILIDGLDEMSKPHGGMEEVFRFLDDLTKLDLVKVCVSSRPEPVFANRFESRLSLRMQDLTRNDIRKYTVDKLKELDVEYDNEKFQKATHEILDRAEGVFIWVYIVLKRIKQGVDEFCESWNDILDRISKLPNDLMGLYRDMLSRFGENDEKYVKKAARYFQYIRQRPKGIRSDIAMLSLVADEDVLDRFTIPDDTPCTETWVKLCRTAEKTLFPVSAGLLEAKADESWLGFASISEGDSKIIPWVAKSVDFIHKSAIDFLEGEEGKRIFGKYTMSPEDMLIAYVKAHLVLRSVTRYSSRPLMFFFEHILGDLDNTLGQIFFHDPHHVLSLVHACSINKTRGLVRPPCSVRDENFFLFQISHYYCYKYVHEFLQSCGSHRCEASAYALIGACDLDPALRKYVGPKERYRMIRDLLKDLSIMRESGMGESSSQHGVTNAIMWAWRCFLLHELSWQREKFEETVSQQLLEEILSLFMKLGVMTELPRPKYLIAKTQGDSFQMVKDIQYRRSDLGYTCLKPQVISHNNQTIYVEVNDAWLVQQLSDNVYYTQEIEDLVREDAFMRILLADNGCNPKEAKFFSISYEGTQDASVDSHRELDSIGTFPHAEPSYMKATYLGRFAHVIPALMEIGYDLPEVNRTHVCLHEWI